LIEISSVFSSQPNLSNDEQPDDGDCSDQKKRLSGRACVMVCGVSV
jgi:hypothetical protein